MPSTHAVLIGGSAGSLDPLRTILSGLPEDLHAAVFVAIHIEPHSDRMLVDIMQKYCKMPMKYPLDEEYYIPSIVYVAPPGHHMLLSGRKVWIFPANFVYYPKPNIDLMLQSAANEFGNKAIAVILSGLGTDGSVGVRAIKEKGGTTIVQSVETAKAGGMLEAAIKSGSVDYVMPPEVMPSTIERLARGDLEDGEKAEKELEKAIDSYRELHP